MKNDSVNLLPPVTVVIPVYNLERYLRDTVESVLKQTYLGAKSIIILDDGSTDTSFQIAMELADKDQSIRALTQKNQGRAKTRNRLLDLAETEFIAWIDGDDIASPEWINDQVKFLLEHDACVAVGGQGYAMTGQRHAIAPIEHPLSHEEIHQRHLSGQANAFFQSCVTVRKSAVVEAGSYDERFPCAEDYSLWLRLAERGELWNLETVHLYYRVHASSANWTANIQQRQQGQQILNEQRAARGLPAIHAVDTEIPPLRKDDWNRRIYWINLSLKSGNPYSAMGMLFIALQKHPFSVVLWVAAVTALVDVIIGFGNQTPRFEAGKKARLGHLPQLSFYRIGRKINHLRRRLFNRNHGTTVNRSILEDSESLPSRAKKQS